VEYRVIIWMTATDVECAATDCREGLFVKIFLTATFVCLAVLILGRLYSYYLDENERIAKGLRRFDH
jgi:hypothetical protein